MENERHRAGRARPAPPAAVRPGGPGRAASPSCRTPRPRRRRGSVPGSGNGRVPRFRRATCVPRIRAARETGIAAARAPAAAPAGAPRGGAPRAPARARRRRGCDRPRRRPGARRSGPGRPCRPRRRPVVAPGVYPGFFPAATVTYADGRARQARARHPRRAHAARPGCAACAPRGRAPSRRRRRRSHRRRFRCRAPALLQFLRGLSTIRGPFPAARSTCP